MYQNYTTSSFACHNDKVFKFPQLLGQDHWRYIELQQVLELEIANYQLHDDLMIEGSAGESSSIEYIFSCRGVPIDLSLG